MQFTEVPVEILKENAGFFKEQICSQSNETINSSILPTSFKLTIHKPIFNVGFQRLKGWLQASWYPTNHCKKYLTTYFQNSNVVFGKIWCHSLFFINDWKIEKTVGNIRAFEDLLNFSSKAFNCLSYDVFMAMVRYADYDSQL